MIRTPVFLFVLSSILAIAANPILAKRPNIILILTDDQDKESIGAYGGDVWTPNLDRMAKEGMLFHNGFVTSTVCTPSRYAFLTGRYPSRSSSEVFMEENPEGQQAFPSFNMGLEPDNMNVAAVLSKLATAQVLSANTMRAESKA
jgi:arylsulfatase A-like enzyme